MTETTHQMAPPRKAGRPRGRRGSLIDWRDPDRNNDVLDWRQRAHEFGLVPVDTWNDEAEPRSAGVIEGPERLLHDEEPEAFEDQHIDEAEREELSADELEEAPQAGVPDIEIDLVRTYLTSIAKRKLLTAREEQDIGRRIEISRGELLAVIATIPSALQTLVALEEAVKRGEAPAAELILLPDGGELAPEKVEPVLKAFGKVRRQQRRINDWRHRIEDHRSTPATRAEARTDIADAYDQIGSILRDLPIRPSVVDNILDELKQLDAKFERLADERLGRDTARERRELESQVGISRRQFRQRFAVVQDREQLLVDAKRQLIEPNLRL